MPPKKKTATKPVLSDIPIEDKETHSLTETLTSLTARQRIPKKPLFRTAKFHSLPTIDEVRIKFWKLKSWSLGAEKMDASFWESEGRAVQIRKGLWSPTLRKSLKGIKRFDVSENKHLKIPDLKRFFPELSKAENLALSANCQNALTKIFLKKCLNPQLKSLNLHSNLYVFTKEGDEFFKKACKYLNKLKKCTSQVKFNPDPVSVGIKLPISFSPVLPNVYQSTMLTERGILTVQDHQNGCMTQFILSLRNSIQELSIACNLYANQESKIEMLQDMEFPHLKKFKLQVQSRFEDQKVGYLSFIKNSPNLEILRLDQREYGSIGSLDFLTFLPNLCEFSMTAESWRGKPLSLELPDFSTLTVLERLKIPLGMRNLQNIVQLMQKNANLKTLEIILDVKRLIQTFTEEVDLGSLQTLTLTIPGINPADLKQIKALQISLLCFKHVQKLDLRLHAFYVSCLHPTLKTLEQFSNLKHFRLGALYSGELEDKKFAKFKDLFKKMPDLRSLELDFRSEIMNSRELASLIDGLGALENLKALIFKASLVKITPTSFSKFAGFLESRKNIREVKIQVKGLSEEEEEQLQKISSRGHQLYEEIIEEKTLLQSL